MTLIELEEEVALDRNRTHPAAAASTPDSSGFAEVVNQHWTAVYRLLYSMTGNTHDTEDLTQETFLRALKRLDTFQPGTQMRAWLLRIGSNVFFDQHRKRRRGTPEPLPEDLAGPQTHPGQSLEMAEQCEIVKAALEGLSELDRMVFHLRVQEDLSFREIGDVVGTSEEAARWHMHQARSKLMNRLAPRREV